MKDEIGARDSEIFLCADVPSYYETAKLCDSILKQSIEKEFPEITETVFNKIRSLHQKDMTMVLLMKRFNLTRVQIEHILEFQALKDTLWKSHEAFIEEEKKVEQEQKEDESEDAELFDMFDDPEFAAFF